MNTLTRQSCKPYKRGDNPLNKHEADQLFKQINDWTLDEENQILSKVYRFKNYYETVAFVNAVAWIAHREDHHPDMQFGYNRCSVFYTTHAVNGLSENDFICAAKIDTL